MPKLTIHCFGNLNVEKDGQTIKRFDTDKSRALLVYLALENQKPLPRSYLAGLLWSDLSEKRALQSLRQTLSILRKALGDHHPDQPIFLSERDLLQINPNTPVWVDALAFQQELSSAYQHFHRQDQPHQLNYRRLMKALDRREGEFLANFSISGAPLFDEWACLFREDLDHRAVEGLALLVHYYQKRGENSLARETAQKILQITPWNESAHLLVMRLYALDGQWSALENQYSRLRRFLSDQLGVEPAHDTVAFFEEVRQKRSKASVLTLDLAPPANLPHRPSSFIGRDKELDEIADLLVNPTCRLLTLHGPGGIGKTRLALEIAHQQVGVYLDGVFYLSLAAISSKEELITALIDGLKIPLMDTSTNAARLGDFLRNKCLLLVLDNFEHLLDRLDDLHGFLAIFHQAKSVKILITSRERLNLAEEWVYPLQGLGYPDRILEHETSLITEFDSLTLFYQRARKVKPDFQLDSEALPAVMQICQLLEGLPLGIELAAADVWSQPCQFIADKISANLNSLRTNANDVAPRYRSLWANLDVSWQLMDSNCQEVFPRLGVFLDGFTVAAAQAIGLADIDVLTRMVNQSLLKHDSNDRYSTHGVIRQYALEKLQSSGAYSNTRTDHAEYFSNFLSERRSDLKSDRQKKALDEIQSEIGNLKHAWNWLLENRQVDKILLFVDPLYQFFNIRSRFQEGIDLFQPAIGLIENELSSQPDREHNIALAIVLDRVGSLAHYIRQNALAHASLTRAYGIFETHAREDELAFCRSILSDVYLRGKDFVNAEVYAQQSLNYFRQTGSVDGETQALYILGSIALRRGQMQSAKTLLHEALRTARTAQDPRRLISPLNLLGDIYCNDGNYEEAEAMFQESLKMATELDDLFQKAILLNNLASIYHVNSQYPKASEMYAKSREICRQIGDTDGEAIALANLGEIALALGNFREAVALSEQALSLSLEIGEEWSIGVCLNNLAEASFGLGECDQSMQYLREAIEMAWKIEAMRFVARFTVTAGRCFQLQGCQCEAKELFCAALAHSSLEHDIRAKAAGWLNELGFDFQPEQDDQALGRVIKKFFINA